MSQGRSYKFSTTYTNCGFIDLNTKQLKEYKLIDYIHRSLNPYICSNCPCIDNDLTAKTNTEVNVPLLDIPLMI